MNLGDWLTYANQGATRNQPISPDLAQALSFLPEMGLAMEVFSGGQPAAGGGPRVGSVRHDHGGAADVFFRQGDRRLDWANPQDVPIFQDIVKRARANGVTGFGAGEGYMQPGSMHIGFGAPAVWGAGGKGANAPGWLRDAFGAAPGGATPPAPQPTANGNQLTFGTAAPAPGTSSMAGLFAANPALEMGTPMGGGARPREDERKEDQRAQQDRRIALADLIRY